MQLWKLPHISLSPETIFVIPGIQFPVTNTLLGTWIVLLLLVLLFYYGTRRSELVPRGLQGFLEIVVEFLLGLAESVAGKEKAKKFFPLAASFFVFILVANLIDLLPGVDTIGQIESEALAHASSKPVLGFLLFGDASNALIPWIRPATTDLNLTLAMALIAVVTAQVYGFMTLGGDHLSKYLNFKALTRGFEGGIEFFVGILEIIGEISRVLSLALRLFGNIFAGSIVLAVFAFIVPFFANVIFLPFELLVAVVQAFVFALLTLIYLQLASTGHEHHDGEHEEHAEHGEGVQHVVTTH